MIATQGRREYRWRVLQYLPNGDVTGFGSTFETLEAAWAWARMQLLPIARIDRVDATPVGRQARGRLATRRRRPGRMAQGG